MKVLTRVFISIVALSVFAIHAQVTIKETKITPTPANSGVEMYKAYCAVCHGVDGKGHGPAVPALKTPPPDLTLLSRNNNGKFPAESVAHSIDGRLDIAAHGSKDMPVWGQSFHRMSDTLPTTVQLRVVNLTKYIESLQQN